MSQYEYAKDTRSDSKYKTDFEAGTHNQQLAIQQLIWDRMMMNEANSYSYHANPDKAFQTDSGMWVYNPDYIVSVNGYELPTEVKVHMAPLHDDVDIKKNQIDRLLELNGVVLYATKQKYSLMYASRLASLGKLVESARFGGKLVYQIPSNKMTWELWISYPAFKGY